LRRFRRKCQIVFQDPTSALNPRLSVEHSIAEALANQGVPRAERRERVAHLLELTGITPRHMRRRPGEFSGGQKQRIVIARALATDPAFLVLDEPVSNLDVSIQAQIINLLLDLKERLSLTYLFISHDLNVIGYVSDRIAVMKDGEIVEQGAAAEIIERPTHPYTRTLFADAPVFHDPRSEPYAQ
jgi:ABC-type glutathione transport system ATPase component